MRRRSSICWRSACWVSPAFGDVARDLRRADDRPRRGPDRGDAERDLDRAAVLAQPHGFVLLDAFAPADPAQMSCYLRRPIGRHDQFDAFCRPPLRAVYPNRRSAAGFQPVMVPSSDLVMMASLEDSHGGAEQAFARGVVVARGFGAAVFLGPRVRARRSLALASLITRAKTPAPARPVSPPASTGMATGSLRPMLSTAAVNRLIGRVSDRARNTANAAGEQHREQADQQGRCSGWSAAGAMKTAFGAVSMMPTHRLPARMAGASAAPPDFPA